MNNSSKANCIGLLGGGQLGKMFAVAAAQYGYQTIALCPEPEPVVADIAKHIQAAYDDRKALDQLWQQTKAMTFEFENIPVATIQYLAEKGRLYPSAKALQVSQDRRLEKTFFQTTTGIETTPFHIVEKEKHLQVPADFRFPGVLKTARDGYDGKGQIKVNNLAELESAWDGLQRVPAVLESFINFDKELSVIIARDYKGHTSVYGPFHNEHENHILATSWAGVQWPETIEQQAHDIAIEIAKALDYVGVLCVELFLVQDRLLVNEIAPRPHNSGHLTIEAYSVSQFQQQVRAVLGLPVANATLRSPAAMVNIIGFQPSEQCVTSLLTSEDVHWHWYGKTDIKPGRKVGHVTIMAPTFVKLEQKVQQVKLQLQSN